MLSHERPAFDAGCKILFAAFNVLSSEERLQAYWTAMQKLSIVEFARLVEHVTGPDSAIERMPTVGQLWAAHRELKKRRFAPAPAVTEDRPSVGVHVAEGNLALLRYLAEPARRAASSASLARLVAEKNRIAGQQRELAEGGEEVPAADKEAVYVRAFDRVYEPAPAHEVDRERARFARERGLEFVPSPAQRKEAA